LKRQYADDEKANVLTSRGWSVLRFWAKDKHDPARVARIIRGAIEVRAPLGAIDYSLEVPPDADLS
jgi:very-short-patch-repair endonuclease